MPLVLLGSGDALGDSPSHLVIWSGPVWKTPEPSHLHDFITQGKLLPFDGGCHGFANKNAGGGWLEVLHFIFISLIPSWQNLELLKISAVFSSQCCCDVFFSFWRMLSTKTHIWAKNWRHWTGTETWAIYQNWGYKDHGFGEFVYSNHLCENFKSFDKSCPTSSPCHQNFFERGWLKWIFFFTVNPYFWSD